MLLGLANMYLWDQIGWKIIIYLVVWIYDQKYCHSMTSSSSLFVKFFISSRWRRFVRDAVISIDSVYFFFLLNTSVPSWRSEVPKFGFLNQRNVTLKSLFGKERAPDDVRCWDKLFSQKLKVHSKFLLSQSSIGHL